MDFRPASFKVHVVHKRFHQRDAAPMRGFEIIERQGIRNRARIKPLALVRDGNRDFFSDFAAAADVN